jgi:hypothetical protein
MKSVSIYRIVDDHHLYIDALNLNLKIQDNVNSVSAVAAVAVKEVVVLQKRIVTIGRVMERNESSLSLSLRLK